MVLYSKLKCSENMRIKDRVRRRLRGLHKNHLEFSLVRELINLAVSRPVNLSSMQNFISKMDHNTEEKIQIIEDCLSRLKLIGNCEQECCNIIVAMIRELEYENIDMSIEFGMKYLVFYQDKRGVSTLVNILDKEGKHHMALDLLSKLDFDWARKRVSVIESSIGLTNSGEISFKQNVEKSFLSHHGMDFLVDYNSPSILLYGDVDMNVIDGSSVWLSSLIEAFSGTEYQVHVLLKCNISRDLLLYHLKDLPNVTLYPPEIFGIYEDQLSILEAVDIIEVLDGLIGGYRTIVIRGFDLSIEVSSRKSLWKRVWAYLTDYYSIKPEEGLIVENDKIKLLRDAQHMFEYFLVQTKELGDNLKNIGINEKLLKVLPPMIPDNMVNNKLNKLQDSTLRIGYCGKIAPMWGVKELIEKVEKISSKKNPVEVHIIGDKIHKNTKQNPTFREDMLKMIQQSNIVIWHGAVSRNEAVKLLSKCDLGWCYRDIWLENNTLELSTKLLENLAINLPFIVTKNTINENLLGSNYPYFVDDKEDLDKLLNTVKKDNIKQLNLTNSIHPHLISTVSKDVLIPLLNENKNFDRNRKRVVIAGTDLKFIGHFESYLKKIGCIVKRDHWKWGEPEFIQRTKKLRDWAEYIWCEWNLANTVWYSNNSKVNQRLISRLHLQEVGQRARRFQTKINMEKVDKIVVVADHILEEAKQLFDWKDEKLEFIPNYVECERLRNNKKDLSSKNIAIVGVVPERKRLDLALDLIEELRKKDEEWKLIVKGRLPHDYPWMMGESRRSELYYYDKQYNRIKKSKYLKNGVEFEGYTLTISEFYNSIGYVLSTSDFESFHYTIADGVSAGNFPIIWPWVGADELYPKDWVTEDINNAVEKIIQYSKLSTNDKLLEGEKKYNFIQENYSLEVILPRLAAILLD